jgi:hypothetical protein
MNLLRDLVLSGNRTIGRHSTFGVTWGMQLYSTCRTMSHFVCAMLSILYLKSDRSERRSWRPTMIHDDTMVIMPTGCRMHRSIIIIDLWWHVPVGTYMNQTKTTNTVWGFLKICAQKTRARLLQYFKSDHCEVLYRCNRSVSAVSSCQTLDVRVDDKAEPMTFRAY